MKQAENLVVIHLSATAVNVVIGQIVAADDIRIKGVGQGKVDHKDYYQGHVIHRERLKSAIKQAIQHAEYMANCRIHSVWLTMSTPELISKNSFGGVSIASESVQAQDIVKSLSIAKHKDLPHDYYLMHYCQQGIYIDDASMMVDDAIGSIADQLSVMYHLMMMPVVSRQNITQLLQSCDVTIDHMLFDAVSSAEYSLLEEERHAGVCLIDLGASTTSVCVYKENKLIFTSCIAQGSHAVTMDISAEMGISMQEAEHLKKRHGTVDIKSVDPSHFISIKRQGDQDSTINMHLLAEIIEARYRDIFSAVFQQLNNADLLDYIDKGVVLSGGGSMMRGLIAFAKRYLNMPVTLTNPNSAITVYDNEDEEIFRQLNTYLKDRSLQTAFGVLLYSQSEQFQHSEKSSPDALHGSRLDGMKQRFEKIIKRIL